MSARYYVLAFTGPRGRGVQVFEDVPPSAVRQQSWDNVWRQLLNSTPVTLIEARELAARHEGIYPYRGRAFDADEIVRAPIAGAELIEGGTP